MTCDRCEVHLEGKSLVEVRFGEMRNGSIVWDHEIDPALIPEVTCLDCYRAWEGGVS